MFGEGDHRSDRDSDRDEYGRGDTGFGEAGYRDERYYAEGGYRTGTHRAPEPGDDGSAFGESAPGRHVGAYPSGQLEAYRDPRAPGRHGRAEPPPPAPRAPHPETGAQQRVPGRPGGPPRGGAPGVPPRPMAGVPRPVPGDNDDTGPIPRIPAGPPPARPVPGGTGAPPRVPGGPGPAGTGSIPRPPAGPGTGAVPRIPPGPGPAGPPTGSVPRLPGGPAPRPAPGGTGALPRTPGGPARPNPAGPRPAPPMPPRRGPAGPVPGLPPTGQHPVAPGHRPPPAEPGRGRPRPADPFPTGRHHQVSPGAGPAPFGRPGHEAPVRREGVARNAPAPRREDHAAEAYGRGYPADTAGIESPPATGGFAVAGDHPEVGGAHGRAYEAPQAYRDDHAGAHGYPAGDAVRAEGYAEAGARFGAAGDEYEVAQYDDAGQYDDTEYVADEYASDEYAEYDADEYESDEYADDYEESDEYAVDADDEDAEPRTGPFDYEEVADILDEISEQRLDLGSIILPVPDGGQLQVEMTPDGTPQAVHLATPHGRLTVAAYAAPKSPGQWRTVATDLAESLRADGAQVSVQTGPWGRELHAITEGADLRFIGIDGYRWMVRLVAAGPSGAADEDTPLVAAARGLLADTVVRRGEEPMPVREPLPVVLPQELADQLIAAHQQQVEAQQQAAAAQAAAAEAAATGTFPAVTAEQQGPRRSTEGSAMQQLGRN
ncbi:hypothetical protein NONO_c53050 [Nocardia nova SH22a]|uniref:DUF3710 domain-containing protein n=1 Tax=Nocardia nova SH22a TaxID=1415166 RepID=W5TL45_9NOCA|nr:hypothetical protein NONO_c53050 [Nocardia nova SH22a]